MANPKYTTKEKVKETVIGSGDSIGIPTTLTDAKIEEWIDERSREIDARLPNYAVFPDISAQMSPPATYGTPKMIRRICRLLAVADCLRDMGLGVHEQTGKDMTQQSRMDALLNGLAAGNIEIPAGEYDYSQQNNKTARDSADVNDSKPVYFSRLTRE